MYVKHFGLSELPFKITPDPRFLWYLDQHKEAKAKIEYHLSQKDGPVYLSADVGRARPHSPKGSEKNLPRISQKSCLSVCPQSQNRQSTHEIYC